MPPRKKIYTSHKCDVCNKGFDCNAHLQRHKKIHTDELNFACEQCDFRCKQQQYLTRHVRAIHQDCRNYECDICGKRFLFPSKLAGHKLVHTGEKPYECNECGKCFNSHYSLKTHMLIHTGEKPFKCSYCAYACRDCSTLRKHEERHQDTVRFYRCLTCHRKMRTKWALKNHIAEEHLNLDLRKYFCDVCHKGFKAKNILTTHVKNVHLRANKASCAVCGLTISNCANMAAHMLTHVDHRPYACGVRECDKTFKTKGDLRKHEIIHKKELHVKCEICDRSFARLSRLERHLRLHARQPKEKTIECQECDERFINPFHLLKHRRVAHPGVRFTRRQKYECDLCGFITYLRSCIIMHLKYGHVGNRYLKHCNECKQKFRKEFSYIIHMATEHGMVIKEAKVAKAKNTLTDKRAIEDIIIKEEIEDEPEESAPVDLFEVEKEEVLEDHLPKEIQDTILNAMQREINDEDYDSDDNKPLKELHTNSIQNDNDSVLQENSNESQATDDKTDVIEDSKNTDSIQKVKDADLSLAISVQYEECPIEYSKDENNSVDENIDNKPNCMEVDSIQNPTDYNQNSYERNVESEDNNHTNSIQNRDNTNEETTIQKDGPQNSDTDSIQNNFHTVDLTANNQYNEDLIHIDKTNYVEVIKQLIIENKNELQKISDEVYDEFFIDRVERKIKKKAKKTPEHELREQIKKEIRQKVVEARRQQLAGALERTRRLYNSRLNRAMGIVNPKEKVKVQYFNKNQVTLVELTPPEDNNTEKEDSNINNVNDNNNVRNETNKKDADTSQSVGNKTIETLNTNKSIDSGILIANASNSNNKDHVNTEKQQSLKSVNDNDNINNQGKETNDLNETNNEKGYTNANNPSQSVLSDKIDDNDGNDASNKDVSSLESSNRAIENNDINETQSSSQPSIDTKSLPLDNDEKSQETDDANKETLQNTAEAANNTEDTSQNAGEITNNKENTSKLLEEKPENEGVSYTSKCKLKLNTHQCYVCFKLFSTKEELLDHCKDHFDVATSTSLKKCPVCAFVTKLSLGTHMKKAHNMCIKVPYGTIHDQNTNQRISKYYYKMDDSESTAFKKIEVIPSVKCLNNIASRKIEKLSRDIKEKTISKTKLVKKGKEWVVENERINFDKSYLLPKFDIKDIEINEKKIKVNAKYKIVLNYIENLKRLYKIAKKKGQKMLFPCKECDKVCLNMSALKLHVRKHDPNKKPFKKKVWKHKRNNSSKEKDKDCNKRRNKKADKTKKKRGVKRKKTGDSIKELYNMSLKERIRRNKRLKRTGSKDLFEMSIRDRINMFKRRRRNTVTDHNNLTNGEIVNNSKTVSKENHRHPRDIENRERKPRPVKNKHKCDPQLIEFYNQNVKGGDIEFWQFLKIFNRMSKENVNEFSDLKERSDFGLHFDDKNGEECIIDDKVNNTNEDSENNVVNNTKTNSSSESTIKHNAINTSIGDEIESTSAVEAVDEDKITNNSKDIDKTVNLTHKNLAPLKESYTAIVSEADRVANNPKTVKNMVAINRSTSKGFKKSSLISKKRVSHLSRDEIARREANKRRLRENLLKLNG